ncbi:MAG: NADP-specific glutamate dehydrogenase [Elusimicrobiota bacterium]|nr:NADP-specific glutamate dehydrogenase [Elusimicrobiota bacterium]
MDYSKIFEKFNEKNKGELIFQQVVREVIKDIEPALEKHPRYVKDKIVERIIQPDRAIMFRVAWADDNGEVQVNKGYRVQFNNAIGPYKGGLRFHPSVNLGIIKFLGFEQIFKNALTTLPMGGGKGGSDFDPKGKSDMEVMRFCHSFMRELYRHIGSDIDIPAGDIGVGSREIGYLFGYYKKIVNEYTGILTGKGIEYGGSHIRPEATGYGLVYFVREMLSTRNLDFRDRTVAISGAGNVAQYASEKVIQLGGKVITLCDSQSTVVDREGLDREKLGYVMHLKNVKRGRIKKYADKYKSVCIMGKNVWEAIKEKGIKVDVALPCATENEINRECAEALVENGCIAVAEGANMPSTEGAVELFRESGILYGPGKAANAGGVAVSGFEMSQNRLGSVWTREEVDEKLYLIMKTIHDTSLEAAKTYGKDGDYLAGANIAGFLKVAKAMHDQGIV